jgi:hypothetical protein
MGDEFVAAFRQLIHGALNPSGREKELIGRWFEVVDAGYVVAAAGILACKLAAIQFLPLTVTAGGTALLELAQWMKRSRFGLRARTFIQLVSVLVLVLLWGAWLLAAVAYFRQ